MALDAAARSGLSVGAWAKQAGVDPQRLHWWRRRLERMTPTPEFVELKRPTPPSGLIEVALVSGDVVRVAGDADPAMLRAIIELLRSC